MNKMLATVVAVVAFLVGVGISTLVFQMTKESPEFRMHVEGNFGAAVTVTTTGFPTDDSQQINELLTGDGRLIEANQQVLMRVTKFTANGDEWSQVADLPTIVSGVATTKSVGKLADVVVGKKEGSRLAVVQPSEDRISITIVDILPTRLRPAKDAPEPETTVPQVSNSDKDVPVVGAVGEPIENVKVSPIFVGKGAQVTDEDIVYANYVLVSPDGTEIENTFTNGNPPAYIALDDVFPGLRAGLVDQRVGSRIAVTVPSAQAQGEGDVVIVVDILALADKKPAAKTTSV